MKQSRRDPMLRMLLQSLDDAPVTVTSACGEVPISAAAVGRLRDRLGVVTRMHEADELSDAQLLAVVRTLVTTCEQTSVLHHQLQPEQLEAARRRALDELVELTESDVVALAAITAL